MRHAEVILTAQPISSERLAAPIRKEMIKTLCTAEIEKRHA